MITEEIADLWSTRFDSWWRCIPTNGVVRRDGRLTMGRGVAWRASARYPELALWLGQWVAEKGNRVLLIPQYGLITFPTKYGWQERSDLELIRTSCRELCEFLRVLKNKRVALPRPGCGNGGLTWEEVGPVVHQELGRGTAEIVVLS